MPGRTTLRKIATVDFASGQLKRESLNVAGKIRRIWLELNGVITVSSTATAAVARNPGTLIPSLRIVANRELVLKEGGWNDFRDRMYIHHKLPAEVAADAAADADSIASRICIDFITPGGIKPVDTVLDMNMFQRLDLEIQWGTLASLVTGGASSFTTAPTVDVIAEVSRFDPPPNGFYIERSIETDSLGTSAASDKQIELIIGERINYHHMILVAEDNVANSLRTLVSTALNEIRIEQTAAGEVSNPVGIISGVELQHYIDQVLGTVDGVQTGIYPIPFQQLFDGRRTFNLETAQLNDLRLRIDHAAFTTQGFIRVLYGLVEPLSR